MSTEKQADAERSSMPRLPGWIGWTAAVVFALSAGYLQTRTAALKTDAALQRDEARFSEIETQSLRQQMEAQQIVFGRELALLKRDRLEGILAAPLVASGVGAPQMRGAVVWSDAQGEGLLIVQHLPAPPSGFVYRAWLSGTSPDEPVPAGTLTSDETNLRVRFRPERPLPRARRLLLSRETAGASVDRPGEVIAIAEW